jgi:hypothetical protein
MIKTEELIPIKFVRLFEVAYNINIFIFSSNGILIPFHFGSYHKFKPTKNTVLLYQNYGNSQVELIVKKEKDKIITKFAPDDLIIKYLFDIFSRLTKSFKNGIQIQNYEFKDLPIESQEIDIYGKCRMINVKFKQDIISILLDPCAPFKCKKLKSINRCSSAMALDFIKTWNYNISWQRVIFPNKVREIRIDCGLILVDDEKKIDNVMIKNDEEVYDDEIFDKIDSFGLNKKISKYFFQNMIYLFSKFIENIGVNVENINNEHYNQFINKFIIIDDSKEFELKNNFKNINKLIIPSKEALIRMINLLKLFVKNFPQKFRKYYENILNPDFYSELNDFKNIEDCFLLFGEKAVENLINVNKISYSVRKSPSETICFLQNDILGDKIYLSQHTKTLNYANSILIDWINLGYNSYSEEKQLQRLYFLHKPRGY